MSRQQFWMDGPSPQLRGGKHSALNDACASGRKALAQLVWGELAGGDAGRGVDELEVVELRRDWVSVQLAVGLNPSADGHANGRCRACDSKRALQAEGGHVSFSRLSVSIRKVSFGCVFFPSACCHKPTAHFLAA